MPRNTSEQTLKSTLAYLRQVKDLLDLLNSAQNFEPVLSIEAGAVDISAELNQLNLDYPKLERATLIEIARLRGIL